VSKILPVLKSPTVLPLLENGWSSIHSVIKVNEFWQVIRKIKELGAEGILVIPIENMII
jgi:ATP phosphoribosyltransferase